MRIRGRPQTISDDDLIDAASAVFLEQGVGATTAAVARKARISESVIFHRYKTKEALFLAVLDRVIRLPPILEHLETRIGQGEVADTLFDIGMGVMEEARRVMPFFMMASMLARASSWKLDELRDRMTKPPPAHLQSVRLLARYFKGETEAGRLRPVDSEAVARMFLGAVMQEVMQQQWLGGPKSSPLEGPTFVRGLVEVFLHGLAAQVSPKPR